MFRFAGQKTVGQLSKWLRPHVTIHHTFSEMRFFLSEFFSRHQLREEGQRKPEIQMQPLSPDNIFASLDRAKENIERARNFFTMDVKNVLQDRATPSSISATPVTQPTTANMSFIKAFRSESTEAESKKNELRSHAQRFLEQVCPSPIPHVIKL